MSLQRELYGAESLMFYFLKSLSCLVFFVYTRITPESLVCSLFCKGGSDPLVWVHLLCHSLDQAQQNPGQSIILKHFPLTVWYSQLRVKDNKILSALKRKNWSEVSLFLPPQWRAALSTSVLRFNESHFCSSLQFGIHGQEHTLRFAGFQV